MCFIISQTSLHSPKILINFLFHLIWGIWSEKNNGTHEHFFKGKSDFLPGVLCSTINMIEQPTFYLRHFVDNLDVLISVPKKAFGQDTTVASFFNKCGLELNWIFALVTFLKPTWRGGGGLIFLLSRNMTLQNWHLSSPQGKVQ